MSVTNRKSTSESAEMPTLVGTEQHCTTVDIKYNLLTVHCRNVHNTNK